MKARKIGTKWISYIIYKQNYYTFRGDISKKWDILQQPVLQESDIFPCPFVWVLKENSPATHILLYQNISCAFHPPIQHIGWWDVIVATVALPRKQKVKE